MNIYQTHDLTYAILWPYDAYRRTAIVVDGNTLADSFEAIASYPDTPPAPLWVGSYVVYPVLSDGEPFETNISKPLSNG